MLYLIEFIEIRPGVAALMTKRPIAALTAAFIALTVFALPSNASNNTVLNNWYTLTWGSLPTLYQVNKTDGTLTQVAVATSPVGSAGNTGAAGLDIDSTNGIGYFVPYSNNPTSLWKIDLTTGTFTEVGNTAAIDVTALDMGISGNIWIAADSLDGQGQGFGKIDRNTGQATYLAAGPDRISALATSADGVLYAFTYSNRVYTVNTTTFVFTQVGTTNASMMAADFDSSGEIILQTWGGQISGYNLSTNTDTAKFTMRINSNTITGEAFAIGGPTDGRTLNQAIAGAPIPGQATPTPTPTSSSTPAASPSPTVVQTLAKTGAGLSSWQVAGLLVALGALLTFVSTRPRNFD